MSKNFEKDASINYLRAVENHYTGFDVVERSESALASLNDNNVLHICPKCGKLFIYDEWGLDVCPQCVRNEIDDDAYADAICNDTAEEFFSSYKNVPHSTITFSELANLLLEAVN